MERNYLRRFNNSKLKAYIIIGVVLIVALLLFIKFNPFTSGPSKPTSNNDKTALKEALKTLPLNREFKFPLKDEKNETVGEIKYTIENVELRDEIIIKGKKAYAVKGRAFLILNLKITNDSSKTISMNTKDYARLFVNNNENEPLSPSIHNDPVVIDAISVKPTRIGFAISENDKNIKLKIGEIKGEKTTVDINF